jgi:hypothetical protein
MVLVASGRFDRTADPATGRAAIAYLGPHPRASGTIWPQGTPQLFRVESDPDSEPIATHFHPIDQFQLIVGGTGWLASHPVGIGSLHYADAYRPYGPIEAGRDGLAFLTLRATVDFGAYYMPASRNLLREKAGRQASTPRRRNITVDLLAAADEPAARHGWHPALHKPDGLQVLVVELGANVAAPPVQVGGAGGYLAVLSGAVTVGRHHIGAGGAAFIHADELLDDVVAHQRLGSVISLMQFPATT